MRRKTTPDVSRCWNCQGQTASCHNSWCQPLLELSGTNRFMPQLLMSAAVGTARDKPLHATTPDVSRCWNCQGQTASCHNSWCQPLLELPRTNRFMPQLLMSAAVGTARDKPLHSTTPDVSRCWNCQGQTASCYNSWCQPLLELPGTNRFMLQLLMSAAVGTARDKPLHATTPDVSRCWNCQGQTASCYNSWCQPLLELPGTNRFMLQLLMSAAVGTARDKPLHATTPDVSRCWNCQGQTASCYNSWCQPLLELPGTNRFMLQLLMSAAVGTARDKPLHAASPVTPRTEYPPCRPPVVLSTSVHISSQEQITRVDEHFQSDVKTCESWWTQSEQSVVHFSLEGARDWRCRGSELYFMWLQQQSFAVTLSFLRDSRHWRGWEVRVTCRLCLFLGRFSSRSEVKLRQWWRISVDSWTSCKRRQRLKIRLAISCIPSILTPVSPTQDWLWHPSVPLKTDSDTRQSHSRLALTPDNTNQSWLWPNPTVSSNQSWLWPNRRYQSVLALTQTNRRYQSVLALTQPNRRYQSVLAPTQR